MKLRRIIRTTKDLSSAKMRIAVGFRPWLLNAAPSGAVWQRFTQPRSPNGTVFNSQWAEAPGNETRGGLETGSLRNHYPRINDGFRGWVRFLRLDYSYE